jgi:hypothetical protein
MLEEESSVTAANLVIGLLVLGLVIYRQVIARPVRSNMRIPLILAVIGAVQAYQFLKGQHIDATIIAEFAGSLVLAAVFGFARAATVRLSFREGQWWSQGNWLTAILWVLSLAAHLGFDALVSGKHGHESLGQATILLYLAVTYGVQRLVVQARCQRLAIPSRPDVSGLA